MEKHLNFEFIFSSREISRSTEYENSLAEPFCGFAFFSVDWFYKKSNAMHLIVLVKLEKLENIGKKTMWIFISLQNQVGLTIRPTWI